MLISFFIVNLSKNIVESTDTLLDKLAAKFRAESIINELEFYASTGKFTSNSIVNSSVKGLPAKIYINGGLQKIDNKTVLSIRDSGSMMSVWAINLDVISNLLRHYKVSSQKIAIIRDSILDWIDRDDLSHINGAESQYYKEKGYKYTPRNFPALQSVYELRLVRGMDNKTFNFLRKYLILSPKWHFNLSTMDKVMLSSALGVPYNLLNMLKFHGSKGKLDLDTLGKITGKLYDPGYYETFPTFVLDIHVSIRFNEALEKRGCVIDFSQTKQSPFRVLKWEN